MEHLLEYVFRPTVFFAAVIVLATANLWRKRREKPGKLLALTIPLVVLAFISVPAVAYVALGTLEWPYPPLNRPLDSPAVLVVLSGYIHGPDDDRPPVELSHDTFYRCMHAVTLYQKSKQCTILVSGGLPSGAPRGPRLAAAMRSFLIDQDVSPADVLIEDRSRTTRENAVECSKILHQRGRRQIVLVTDARHMLRAKLSFEKEGLEVTPAPCNFLTAQFQNRWENYLPSPGGAVRFQEAFHEWLGIAYYWLRGWV
jgi:uncharacterized SAM-binding protein YcdF (DUF218 family)